MSLGLIHLQTPHLFYAKQERSPGVVASLEDRRKKQTKEIQLVCLINYAILDL